MGFNANIQSDTLLHKLNEKESQITEKLELLANSLGLIGHGKAVDEAPRDTGNLKASIRVEEGDELLSRIIYPDEGDAPYAMEVIHGTMAHIIEGNPYLYWPGADHPVTRVFHPGTVANPFIDRAEYESQGEWKSEVEEFESWLTDI